VKKANVGETTKREVKGTSGDLAKGRV
jgi:hypothetical protein